MAPMVRGPQSTVEREQVLACVAGLLLFAQFPAPEIERAADAGERANHVPYFLINEMILRCRKSPVSLFPPPVHLTFRLNC
jgi:hypothetical protein